MAELCESWPRWAAVRKPAPGEGVPYDEEVPDFLEGLLPFQDHPLYQDCSAELRHRVLACGWLLYNAKVIQVEGEIVSPACKAVAEGRVPGALDLDHRQALAQTLVDEAYHVLMLLRACRVTHERRRIPPLQLGPFGLVTRLRELKERQAEPWQRTLLDVLCAVAVETSISDYLRVLSAAPQIQPLHRLTTAVHLREESVHAGLFQELLGSVHRALRPRERAFFERALREPWLRFAGGGDLENWRIALEQIGFRRAREMMDDCEAEVREPPAEELLGDLRALAAPLGIAV